MELTLCKVRDFSRLETVWRSFESEANVSFFQTWAWTGCLIEERFSDPILLEARQGDCIRALALFSSTRAWHGRATLWLGESGDTMRDAIFIERNGILLEKNAPTELLINCLQTCLKAGLENPTFSTSRSIRLSGVDEQHLLAARACGRSVTVRTLWAPAVEFESLRRANTSFLETLSRNTRYQIRRSEREYGAIGPLRIERARTVDEAQCFLTSLIQLHQKYWIGRGRKGAYANPFVERFHRTLIVRAFGEGGIDFLRVSAGQKTIGYLYNLAWHGYVSVYQSGFNYEPSNPHLKPGLTSHHLAIEMYLAEGARSYDFLAGADRYKVSLSTTMAPMHWIEIGGHRIINAFAALISHIRAAGAQELSAASTHHHQKRVSLLAQ